MNEWQGERSRKKKKERRKTKRNIMKKGCEERKEKEKGQGKEKMI